MATTLNFDIRKIATKDRLSQFAEELERLSRQIGFKVSSRGWCYQLETENLITKAEFDRVESLINRCRKEGILPIDFTAEEEGRKFTGVEIPNKNSPIQEILFHLLFYPNYFDCDLQNNAR